MNIFCFVICFKNKKPGKWHLIWICYKTPTEQILLTVFLTLTLLDLMIILIMYRELCENLSSQTAWCPQIDLSASTQNYPNRFWGTNLYFVSTKTEKENKIVIFLCAKWLLENSNFALVNWDVLFLKSLFTLSHSSTTYFLLKFLFRVIQVYLCCTYSCMWFLKKE